MTKVKIIKHSKSAVSGKEIVTFEIEYQRFIHAEFLTHRKFSRNSASSRAIPIEKMINHVWNNPSEFVYWGKNKKGMSAGEELTGWRLRVAKWLWKLYAKDACIKAWILSKVTGAHKQNVNRILEPYQNIKVVVTATDWNNFFALRDHKDAQPEIKYLAHMMRIALDNSDPQLLQIGEWHIPYVDSKEGTEDNLKMSASLCAQVSYRTANDSQATADKIYQQLVVSRPVHASPTEHQAQVLNGLESGNFMGKFSGNFDWSFLQWRQTIPHNTVHG
jgi:thymidylate synthase ThyX